MWVRCSGAWHRSRHPRVCRQQRHQHGRYLDLEIDEPAREVRRDQDDLGLTRAEFDLLIALTEVPGVAWTRERLGDRVFGAGTTRLRPHDRQPRQEPAPRAGQRAGEREYIETVRGVGYRAARE